MSFIQFLPTAFKSCVSIFPTMLAGTTNRHSGSWAGVFKGSCPGCMSKAVRCKKLPLGIRNFGWGSVGVKHQCELDLILSMKI